MLPKGTTHIVGNEKKERFIKVTSDPYFVRTSARPRQDFSYWHEWEEKWVYLGLITLDQYLSNHKFKVKQFVAAPTTQKGVSPLCS